jgi:hypothetical protein
MGIEIGNASGVVPLNVANMDLESALMAVQTNRANALEAGLKDQIGMVQKKNEKIAVLNDLLSALNVAQAKVDAQAKAGDLVTLSPEDRAAISKAATAAGITNLPKEVLGQSWTVKLVDGTQIPVDAAGKKEAEDYKAKNWAFRSSDYSGRKGVASIEENKPTKGQLDGAITSLKSTIDGLSNTQQMDMLRLQSMSNKRNEAFEIMTNFIKKQADNRSSIVGNMR